MCNEFDDKKCFVVENWTTIDPDYKNQPLYSLDDFANHFAKILGQRYGIEDIRML